MKKSHTLGAGILALTLASAATAQESAPSDFRGTPEDLMNTLIRLPAETPQEEIDAFRESMTLHAFTSDAATEQDRVFAVDEFTALVDLVSTCDENDNGIGLVTITGISAHDLDAGGNGTVTTHQQFVDTFTQDFDDANIGWFLEVAPQDQKPENLSVKEWQLKYYYEQFANKIEADSGLTPTIVVIEVPDPSMGCNIPMEEVMPMMPD